MVIALERGHTVLAAPGGHTTCCILYFVVSVSSLFIFPVCGLLLRNEDVALDAQNIR